MHKWPRLSPLAHYDLLLEEWIHPTSIKDFELLRSHGFGYSHSLSKIIINSKLVEAIVERWNTKDRVLRFCTIEICPTIEECKVNLYLFWLWKTSIPSFKLGFKQRALRNLGNKKKLQGADYESVEYKKCPLSFLCDLYAANDAYKRHRSSFLINHDIWTCNRVNTLELSILGYILYLRNPSYVIWAYWSSRCRSSKAFLSYRLD